MKSKKRIDELFSNKLFIQNSILRIYYAETELDAGLPAQFGFAVSKKSFPLATDRNKLKRLMRESVRKFKPQFYELLKEKNMQMILLLHYHAKQISPYKEVDEAVTRLLQKLTAQKSQ